MWRPVWYLFLVKGGGAALWSAANPAAAVVGLANPVVVYAGEAAILVALFRFVARRERDALIVVVGFFSQFLPWMANPKGLEFSYLLFSLRSLSGPRSGAGVLPRARAVAGGGGARVSRSCGPEFRLLSASARRRRRRRSGRLHGARVAAVLALSADACHRRANRAMAAFVHDRSRFRTIELPDAADRARRSRLRARDGGAFPRRFHDLRAAL